MEGARFVSRLTCPGCWEIRPLLKLDLSLEPRDYRCLDCGERMYVSGFHNMERLVPSATPDESLRRSLDTIGIRPGDVLSVGPPGRERHVELGGAP